MILIWAALEPVERLSRAICSFLATAVRANHSMFGGCLKPESTRDRAGRRTAKGLLTGRLLL